MASELLTEGTGSPARGWRQRQGLCIALLIAALSVAVLAVLAGSVSTVWAQDGTPGPGQESDFCLVSLSSEKETIGTGEPVRLWVWGAGVEPDSWNLELDGAGSVSLQSAREVESWAELIELTVVGEGDGEVTVSASMVCKKPGDGGDSLTLMVLPAGPAPRPTAEFCAVQLSVSDQAVAVGGEFFAWFVGAGTVERSWNLDMEGDGSARVVGTRELDPEYVEWRLEAVEAGTVRLTGAMGCVGGGGAVNAGEVVIAERGGGSGTTPDTPQDDGLTGGSSGRQSDWWGTTAVVQIALMAALLVVLVVLAYVMIRRR